MKSLRSDYRKALERCHNGALGLGSRMATAVALHDNRNGDSVMLRKLILDVDNLTTALFDLIEKDDVRIGLDTKGSSK